ncbi:MAG: sulfatase-like hydrolase/transferase [Verrucomicrobia bacterium]|jgi:arylsulfatase A-like enzyme|nr:sulfatase-like hydrolase/transferase [Verrucomicrobiota bacterium]
MRILYIDIDALRPDHLGCYGYQRETSPNIDRIAAEGVRLENCYTPDAPCLPSRSALFSGRCGYHTGVVNHGGAASQPFIEGPERSMRDRFGHSAWPVHFRKLGYHTVALSTFGERHSAWHYYAGFNEIHNIGKGGNENADEVEAEALRWLEARGAQDNWFMHLNLWDPHTAYRAPESFGEPFADDPIPEWYTESVRSKHWQGSGPHSAREVMGYSDQVPFYLKGRSLPRQPWQIDSMAAAKRVFDGYDTGVRYADQSIGSIVAKLEALGVLEETAIIVSADHGENLGELNVYGDHQTADQITHRVPCIIRWPGVTDSQADKTLNGLYYNLDFAATAVELAGGTLEPDFEGRSFADTLRGEAADTGRESLVLSQSAWCVQRAARWGDYLYIRTFHDAWHDYPADMLFNLADDPHEQNNLAADRPELVETGKDILRRWKTDMQAASGQTVDPLETTLKEGGSLHAREGLAADYLARLRATDRREIADRLEAKYASLPKTTGL